MSAWKMSPQGTADEAFQAYEATEGLANVAYFFFFAHLFSYCGTWAPASLNMRKEDFNQLCEESGNVQYCLHTPSLGIECVP